ncbi:MAG: hypothetical protein V1664_01200 [Candidatus Uhrbacteria bacterium]
MGIDSTDNYGCIGLYNARENAFAISIPGDNNYQSGMVGQTANSKFSSTLIRCDDLEYSFNCYDCTHCFGCVGLFHKKFCLFNKQYDEVEYWQKVDELKSIMLDRGEYGRPIPLAFSFTYFPNSGIMVYLAGEEKDWETTTLPRFNPWDDGAYGEMRLDASNIRSVSELPDSIDSLTDDWLGVPILDPEAKRPFAILKSEAEFYHQHHIAPPSQHFTARIFNLMRSSNSLFTEPVKCQKCTKSIQASLNPKFKERKVFCSDCYLKYLEENN